MPQPWYLVHTRHHAERLTMAALEARGFWPTFPMVTRWFRHAGQSQIVSRPFFPRYLFLAFRSADEPFGEVRKVPGVEYVVARSERYVRVPEKVVDGLRQMEAAGMLDETLRPPWSPGDVARLLGGPVADELVEILEAPTGRRIHVLMRRFDRRISVPLDRLARVAS